MELLDQGNRKYCPCVYVMNKIDQITIEELDIIAEVHKLPDFCDVRWLCRRCHTMCPFAHTMSGTWTDSSR